MEEDLREEVLKINQVAQQVQVLEVLRERKMCSSELQSFVEELGLDWVLLLPILKKTNLLKIEKMQDSRQFWYWIPDNGNGQKEEKLKVVLANDKTAQRKRNKIKQKTRKRTGT